MFLFNPVEHTVVTVRTARLDNDTLSILPTQRAFCSSQKSTDCFRERN